MTLLSELTCRPDRARDRPWRFDFYGHPVSADTIDAHLKVLTGKAPTDFSVCDDPLNVT